MKMQKVLGLCIVAISMLTLSLQLSMARLSRYIDETTGEFWSKGYEYKYIHNGVYILFIGACVIGIYLIFENSKNN